MKENAALRAHAKFPLRLLLLAALLCVGPGLLAILALLLSYRRMPLSHLVYGCVFLHLCILIYGGVYTYANTPLGNWAKEAFDLSRNHYDRVGHLALGVFPAIAIREVLLRVTPLRAGGWFYFIINCVVLAIAAFWELLEWWVALLVSSQTGTAFLGSQGDVWDAQWDMLLALIGSMLILPLTARLHERSMARVPTV
jgi:putative membrane protein